MATRSSYNEDSIQHHKGLEGCRKRPGMYLGERGDHMVFTLVKELVDNSFDEFLAKRNSAIEVWADSASNTYIVADSAEGIPVGLHKKAGISTLTLIFTELHAGGKFNNSAYTASSGCFTGDTRVFTLDGMHPSFEKLWEKWKHDPTPFYVLSRDDEGRLVPRKCYHVQKSKIVNEIARVHLSSGAVISCTLDHPFYLSDGSVVQAKNLSKHESLDSLHWEYDSDGYIVSNRFRQNFGVRNLHRVVAKTILGAQVEGLHVHHKDEVVDNNVPSNLKPLSPHDHYKEHPEKLGLGCSTSAATKNAVAFNDTVDKVVIERVDPTPVYGISVEDFHNYVLFEGPVVGNTHGVGSSAVNAVCSKFEVWTYRDKAWHHQAFSEGKPLFAVKKSPPPSSVTSKLRTCGKLGTIIRIQPDQSIVSVNKGKTKAVLPLSATALRLKNLAFLNRNLKITFTAGKKTATYLNNEGIVKVVKSRVAKQELEPLGKPLVFESDQLQFALQWTSYTEDDGMQSFVSCSPTRDGGSHQDEFFEALIKTLAVYKTSRDKYTPRDVRNGLIGCLNWNMSGPEFSSQVKDRLTSNLNKGLFTIAFKELTALFAANKTLAKSIIKRASEAKKAKEEFKKVMDGISKVNAAKRGIILPNILATARRCKPSERELFLVEGESASGTAKRARNINFQEVLRLNGKPMNAMRKPLAALLKSKAIVNILAAIGYDHRQAEPHKHLRVERLYCLADADPDGEHINALILTVIHRLLPQLFVEGRVFICNAPLFSAYYKGQRYFGKTHQECHLQMPKGTPKDIVTRSKGWGELPPEVLEIIAFHPETRNVIKLSPPKDKKEQAFYDLIMGSDTSGRKALLGL